jgi:hypothetical protein
VHTKFLLKTQGKIPLEDPGINVRKTLELIERDCDDADQHHCQKFKLSLNSFAKE